VKFGRKRGEHLLSFVEVMAERTDWRVWRDLIDSAPDSSYVSIWLILGRGSLAGM